MTKDNKKLKKGSAPFSKDIRDKHKILAMLESLGERQNNPPMICGTSQWKKTLREINGLGFHSKEIRRQLLD